MRRNLREASPLEIQQTLLDIMPLLARSFILDDELYADKADPFRQRFADNPDDVLMHESDWHQWGVITHSRNIEDARPIAEKLLGEVLAPVAIRLSEDDIDHFTKWQLCLVIAPVLHDWGKFTRRVYLGSKSDGRPNFNFDGHEEASGMLVRRFRHFLTGFDLTYAQVEYLARCAELHFELGKVRKAAKQSETGYTFGFLTSRQCEEECASVIQANPGMADEIGAFFAVDNLAKVEILAAAEAKNDADLLHFKPKVEAEVKQTGLPKRYVTPGLELSYDLALARRYFSVLNKMTR